MFPELSFDPKKLPRELKKFYLSMSDEEMKEILASLNLSSLDQLFEHIPDDNKFLNDFDLGPSLSYKELIEDLSSLAKKNASKLSFLGDGLTDFSVPKSLGEICNIRGLTTAYTPYQPERSQGTLWALWLYSSTLAALTGFEAINSSLYERSTCIFEAIQTALRLKRKTKALVAKSIYPQDINVLETLRMETKLEIDYIDVEPLTGTLNIKQFKQKIQENGSDYAAFVFPQVNHFGLLEDVDQITDLCSEFNLKSIAIINPFHLAALIEPAKFGSQNQGVDMIIGEGQNLALKTCYGGPGLGIFGIRHTKENKNDIRSTAGRFIGKGEDINGIPCKTMVLSTREQHIRRDKATSNICSNQAFVAVLAGASLLLQGDEKLSQTFHLSQGHALEMAAELTKLEGVDLAFPGQSFVNELTLKTSKPAIELIKKASAKGIQIGVDLTDRTGHDNFLLISFYDHHTKDDLNKMIEFFKSEFDQKPTQKNATPRPIEKKYLRSQMPQIPCWPEDKLLAFYQKLGQLNLSPDDHLYPLGSCTMKYNPHINDWAAGLEGFTSCHPQALEENVQGSLELLYQIQEMFKSITGLCAVTTQPVAGAQGELVGLKMFQAYHRDRGEQEQRNIILIPRSAHGTNPATATMAGFESKKIGDQVYGIILIEAEENGLMNMQQIQSLVQQHQTKIAGIMVTNPNTSGIFEKNFKQMSELIHSIGGLVYMDGANMNAIAGIVDLNKIGVDAVHNNLHKTWTIPHGGGGPGDAIVAVSERLKDYLPGKQIVKNKDFYSLQKPAKSIGDFHRHQGNFAHKVRCYTYLKTLGTEGVKKMSSIAVLSARYLQNELSESFPNLPTIEKANPSMHEFIITLEPQLFKKIEEAGIRKADIIARVGKLFLDYGLHAPTVSFPEPYGLMIEPTESFSKKELDHFVLILKSILGILEQTPEVLHTVPHFTPIARVDEVKANKNLQLFEKVSSIPELRNDKISPKELIKLPLDQVKEKIIQKHKELR